MEILNKDVITAICIRAPYRDDHSHLLSALLDRYPGQEFIQVAERGVWSSVEKGLCTAGGDVIANSFRSWVSSQYDAAGRNAKKVWDKYKDEGMVLTEWQGNTVYLAAPYGTEPDAYLQIELEVKREVTWCYAFESDPWSEPDDLDDLLSPMSSSPPEQELQPPRYEMKRIVDVRRFVREMAAIYHAERQAKLPEMLNKVIRRIEIEGDPVNNIGKLTKHYLPRDIPFLDLYPDWPEWKHPCVRLFQDWQESSAGQNGHRFCRHWFLQVNDYTDKSGKRYMSAIPQWADGDGGTELPEIHPDEEESPLATHDTLCGFDRQAGYPFAWYFYMLHGNRISHNAGKIIVQGLNSSLFQLPACDEKVLLRWYERQYGF